MAASMLTLFYFDRLNYLYLDELLSIREKDDK